LENTQKATVEEALANPKWWSEKAYEALQIRQSMSKTSAKKYVSMKNCVGSENRARGLLYYHGADTGRWAGRIIQPQNFPRGTLDKGVGIDELCADVIVGDKAHLDMLYGDAMAAISSALRGAITAGPGKELICADYSSIEARGTFWAADDEKALAVFATGRDIYLDMASQIYDVTYESIPKSDKRRQTGKQAILGLGYQMGAERFQETCAGYGMDFDIEFCEAVVKTYRGVHWKVKQFWYDIDAAAREAVQRGSGAPPVEFNRFKLQHSASDFLQITLPSGRKLSYYQPRIKEMYSERFDNWSHKLTFMGVNSMTRQFNVQQTYGGKLTENVIQALSRDIMAEAMLAAEETGLYLPILTVHDEIVVEVPEGEGDVKEFEQLISRLPKWARGFPLAAEGWRGKRYRK
jgi:DNA polymerase